MNSACDNYTRRIMTGNTFEMMENLWYFMLIKDPDFTDAVINRYWQLRKTYFSEEYLFNYIDETEAYLGEAIDRNYEVWGYTFEKHEDFLRPDYRNPRTYREANKKVKHFLRRRLRWMDENIETLKQYSTHSRVKKFDENAN